MKMEKIYSGLFLMAAVLAVSCEENILRDTDDVYVTLSDNNTYKAGEEVRFNIKGNPDYVYFFSGEVGSQYEYRDRTTIAMEDLETCTLVIQYQARYGSAGALDVYASKVFEGLKGDDAQADLATMQAIEAGMDANGNIAGWEKLDYQEGASNVWTTQEYDITDYADSFCLAFHWHPAAFDATQRTYWINISVKTKFRGYDEVTTSGSALGLMSVSMNTDYIPDPYYKDQGNGSVRFSGDYDVIMQGVGANVLPYALNSWVVTTPRPLNNISPDSGFSVKAIADDIYEYAYTYEKAGSYEATFMLTNGNYQGVNRKIQHVALNIIEPIVTE